MDEWKNIEIGKLALDSEPNVLCWNIDDCNNEDTICIWIGADDQNLFNLQLALKGKPTHTCYNVECYQHFLSS